MRLCKSLLPPAAAKDYFDRGCVKRFLPPSAAEYYFERHLIFEISLREISKMMCLSKHNLARSAKKNLFTQPQIKSFAAKPRRPLVNSYKKKEAITRKSLPNQRNIPLKLGYAAIQKFYFCIKNIYRRVLKDAPVYARPAERRVVGREIKLFVHQDTPSVEQA